jgi:hypothetical protein
MANQWPDFTKKIAKHKTVRRVIIEEGAGISEKTAGEITFVVESKPEGKGGFAHFCFLYVPKTGYRYPLLRVLQSNLNYPVQIFADVWPQGVAAGNEAELRKDLGLVFRSDATENTVLQLLDMVS